MTVNIKFNQALAICKSVLSKPAGERHGITGFWHASLRRVQDQRLIRLADMTHRRFVLEAEIDPAGTHMMVPERMEEYIDHELLKRSLNLDGLSPDEVHKARDKLRQLLRPCDRIVIAFRNAHVLGGEIEHRGKNPVWYTED